jgi:hypothetical protein
VEKKDFTLAVYKKLLLAITDADYRVFTINEYLTHKAYHKPFIVLRHDVDRSAKNALKMAQLESFYKIRSTYYFRVNKKTFIPKTINKITRFGHEIGYHYEVLDKAKGDFFLAEKIFNTELKKLRKLAEIKTACMHGNPLSPWDNRNFWEKFSLAKFDLRGEAYLDINDKELFYSTDTGRGWNRKRYNLKDTFSDSKINHLPEYASTWQLIDAIQTRKYKKIYLQIHPNRWNWNVLKWNMQLAEDLAVNAIKLLISNYRRKRDNI